MTESTITLTQTARTTAPGQASSGAQGAALSGGKGVFSAGAAGLNFFDLIFSRIAETHGTEIAAGSGKKDQVTPQTSLFTQATLTNELPAETVESGITPDSTDLAALLGDDLSDPALLIESIANTAQPESTAGPELQPQPTGTEIQRKLKTIIESLLSGQPDGNTAEVIKLKPGQLKKITDELGLSLDNAGEHTPSLIATGLTPEDLSRIIEQIQSGEDITDASGTIIGLVKILPEKSAQQSIFIPKALILTKSASATGDQPQAETAPSDELAAAMNALTVGTDVQETPEAAEGAPSEMKGLKEKSFNDVLKLLEQIQAKTAGLRQDGTPAPGLEKAISAKTAGDPASPGPVNSTLGAKFSEFVGSLMNSSALDSLFPDGSEWSQNNSGINNTHVTSTAQMTSLVTHARNATHPHAATQAVAATLVKSAVSGESKSMTLRLDPPDLGRIEIHMQFTKDKTMKAHMVIEKPETLLMLQRDSQILERSLQEAGMDAGGNDLSFELAGQDHDFDGHGRNGNGAGYGNGHGAETVDPDIIETTMTWYVDEETGLTRYDILA